MKSQFFLLIILVVFFYACDVNKKFTKKYYYVEPFKEQDVTLTLKADSTFVFSDLMGCNQFEFMGVYKHNLDSIFNYLIFDSVKFKQISSAYDSPLVFSIKTGDTAWIINKERIFIQKVPFHFTRKTNLNLQKIRYQKLKEYYINLLGRAGFIKTFGNGKGIREAKRRILGYSTPDINFK
jgi:hypothetical protein